MTLNAQNAQKKLFLILRKAPLS